MTDWSLLDAHLEKVRVERERTITVEVDEDISLVCRIPSDGGEFERLQIATSKKRTPNTALGRAFLATITEQILLGGQPLGDDGEVYTFRSPELQSRLGVRDASEAVFALLGSDIAAGRVIEQVNAEVAPEADPTQD